MPVLNGFTGKLLLAHATLASSCHLTRDAPVASDPERWRSGTSSPTIPDTMIITIDGPAGSGKSTAARKLAARLELPYLDTGAMYRAIAHQALGESIDFEDADALVRVARSLDLELDCGPTHTRVKVNGHDVSEAIRGMAVSAATSIVARIQA
ncbi:MAG: hypothetical protein GY842_13015, partial [bacterium]|nr:hypothetical protein [bacterium]